MISIRNIKDSDYLAISNFFNNKKELQYSFPKIEYPIIIDQIRSIIDSRSNQIVLVNNDIPIGFTDLYNIVDNYECYIGNFIIDKNHRGNGYSTILLKEIISNAIRVYKSKKINIFCWCENTNALILYSKFNFKPVELIIREFDKVHVPVLKLELIVH